MCDDIDGFIRADRLLEQELSEELLDTGLPTLNALLDGGLPPGTFAEVVGLSGSGKSQFCMQLAVRIQKSVKKRKCVYIDTEGSFRTSRICEIASHLFSSKTGDEILSAITISRCRDIVELTSAVYRLKSLLEEDPEVGLVIIDSIAMPLRGDDEHAQSALLDVSRALTSLIATFRCIIVAANHVISDVEGDGGSEPEIAPALGRNWSHIPNMRFWLNPPDARSANWSLTLAKSSFAPIGTCCFRVTEAGLCEVPDDSLLQ